MGEVLPPLCLMICYPRGAVSDPALGAASLDSKGDREKRSRSARGGRRMVPDGPSAVGLSSLEVDLSALVPMGRHHTYAAFFIEHQYPSR